MYLDRIMYLDNGWHLVCFSVSSTQLSVSWACLCKMGPQTVSCRDSRAKTPCPVISQATFEGDGLVTGCRGSWLKNFPGGVGGRGSPSLSLEGRVHGSLHADGRGVDQTPCFMQVSITLASHTFGPSIAVYLKRSLVSLHAKSWES